MNSYRRDPLLITTLASIAFLVCSISYLISSLPNNKWKKETTPLPLEAVKTLCENFNLPKNHRLCDGKRDVYAPDFYRVIGDAFRPYEEYEIDSIESATYEDVEKKIGAYKFKCESVATTGDGFSFFTCLYDLRGDRFSTLMIIFSYPQNAVFRITGSPLDDY
jgi:hypothetical protein